MKFINIIFLVLLGLILCKLDDTNEKFDTSDNNPIAYCLRLRNDFNEEQILNFLVEIQDPEKAVALYPYGGKLSQCVQQRLKEVREQNGEN